MHWELQNLEQALNAGDIQLAQRYASKMREQLFCVKCKKSIRWHPFDCEQYYKGYVHERCLNDR